MRTTILFALIALVLVATPAAAQLEPGWGVYSRLFNAENASTKAIPGGLVLYHPYLGLNAVVTGLPPALTWEGRFETTLYYGGANAVLVRDGDGSLLVAGAYDDLAAEIFDITLAGTAATVRTVYKIGEPSSQFASIDQMAWLPGNRVLFSQIGVNRPGLQQPTGLGILDLTSGDVTPVWIDDFPAGSPSRRAPGSRRAKTPRSQMQRSSRAPRIATIPWRSRRPAMHPTRSLLVLVALLSAPARAAHLPEARLAREAAQWLLAQAQPDGEGLVWPEIAGESAFSLDLYSGSAGVLLALLAGHEATGEERLAETARKSVAGLLARAERSPAGLFWNTVPRDREGNPGKRIGAGLYTGTAGIAAALLEAGERLGIEEALAAGREGLAWVAGQGRAAEGGGLWWEAACSDVIAGNAGIILALLRAHELLGDEQLLACAGEAGQALLGAARKTPEGWHWPCYPGQDRVYHGFSHGTAGVAYALALLGLRTGRGEFLEAAKRGADYLWQVRVEDESGIRWQRGLEQDGRKGEEREGWCHGIAGTARLFLLLHGISGEPRHLEAVTRGWRWMAGKYRPDRERAASRFWSPSLCCGAAGVGEFMLEVYRHTGDPEALAYAVATAGWLERIADRPQPGQACWSLTPRPDPRLGRVAQRTSLMLGAAGQLLFLSRLAAIRSGVPGPGAILPDQHGLAGPPGRRALVVLLGPGAERYRRTARLYQALRGAEWARLDRPHGLTGLVRARAVDQVALVVAPEALDIDLHRAVVDALCRVDEDPFADAGFGYLTGRTPIQAEALVLRAAQAEAEGVPQRFLRIAVASNLTRALHVPPRPAASALLPGWTEESFYLNTVEKNPACRADVPRALARIPGQGALLLTGCGDPIKTWLFSDRRNLDPRKHWPFDPARVRAELDDPEMPGLGASDLAEIAFGPLVVSTGVCHHGVPLRALVQGDIVSTFGQTGGLARYFSLEPAASFCLGLLARTPAAYVAPIGANHGGMASLALQRAMTLGEPLGEVVRRGLNDVALAFLDSPGRPRIPLVRRAEGEPDPVPREPGRIMREGALNRLLYGDPCLVPFPKTASAVAVKGPEEGEGASLYVLRIMEPNPTESWDMFRGGGERYERLHATVPLTPGLTPDRISARAQLADQALPLTSGLWAVERSRLGPDLLHLHLNAAGGPGREKTLWREGVEARIQVTWKKGKGPGAGAILISDG